MVSSSSESRTTTTAIEDIQKKPLIAIQCRRCLSDSSPVVIVNPCDHRFCVKCILFLWSRQKQREPCVCPLDGEKIILYSFFNLY
ncbi:hypothetical protein ARALYDRAFT_903951 [Arabidopsis lyrata subsp. lyrata]|uniref:RING-type domain-containing protein n=1 Tax=Arabidopsis lyrata subsp. lyrata TaxID=81972 RepID=D7LBV9_ARALL|nr:hypothetical protein ARALYDRAFT_903951 [Arabidopsis lyrata subsp. lyrata]